MRGKSKIVCILNLLRKYEKELSLPMKYDHLTRYQMLSLNA